MDIFLKIHSNCVQCDGCKLICPENAIFSQHQNYFVENWACSLCFVCVEICPTDAIKLHTENNLSNSNIII